MSSDHTGEAIDALLILKAAELNPAFAEKFPLTLAEAREAIDSLGYWKAFARERQLAPTLIEKPNER